MTKNRYKYQLFIGLFIGCLFASCTEKQDEHYYRSDSLPGENLFERIVGDARLSAFKQLVEIAGYDSLLTSSQTFTVFAPVNEALSGLDLNALTQEDARRIAGNHIARFSIPSSMTPGKMIRMINNKMHTFSNGGELGGSRLLEKDLRTKNGILHSVETQLSYQYNLYEFIQSDPSTTQPAAFIRSFEEELFDVQLSIPLDVNEFGQTVYDTVTTFYNRLFDDVLFGGLGPIYQEDSVFTLLIPDDRAWDAAYEKLEPYFKRYHADPAVADSIRHNQISLAILENSIFRGRYEDPASLDSIISTSPTAEYMHNPGELFGNASRIEGSNGLIYLAGDFRYNETESWNKQIIVESDVQLGRLIGPGTAVYTRTTDMNTEIAVSESRYITVEGANTSVQPEITFEIPNILAGRYNVYVEFLPGSIDGLPNDSTKVMFDLGYINAAGRMTNRDVISNSLVTSGTKKVIIPVVQNFDFPISNCYDRLWMQDFYKGLYSIENRVFSTTLK
ncbi:MAG: fasciclin domain-containing protein, partial [Candidatus Symbiothrix sp.]|nr:fasciclin domain-containing protein [Candidatus Symbiothrix sp.]